MMQFIQTIKTSSAEVSKNYNAMLQLHQNVLKMFTNAFKMFSERVLQHRAHGRPFNTLWTYRMQNAAIL